MHLFPDFCFFISVFIRFSVCIFCSKCSEHPHYWKCWLVSRFLKLLWIILSAWTISLGDWTGLIFIIRIICYPYDLHLIPGHSRNESHLRFVFPYTNLFTAYGMELLLSKLPNKTKVLHKLNYINLFDKANSIWYA